MRRAKILAVVWLASLAIDARPRPAAAGEIGWIENFSLATDRSVPLEQLIPGTEDYYFFYCLHYQNTEQWDKVEQTLKTWVDRYNWTARALEIQNRQALLTYKKDPARALALIVQRLNLQFNHQREQLNQKPNLPIQLDPGVLSREKLDQQAFGQFPNTLQGFEDAALERLLRAELNGEQRRQLLARLQRPDHAKLVKLVIEDLNFKDSGGFGQFEIHRRLLLDQLNECLKLKPDLLNQVNFINVYLLRLHPSDDVNWRQDRPALLAYLERLWAFVTKLDDVHNSLKAHVLYHRLVLDRALGKYDAERFLEYLKLPKHTVYIAPKYMEAIERQQRAANLQQDFTGVTMLPPIGDDEPLVRSYLAHFLLDAADFKAYAPYVNDLYLKRVFAETKIVHGVGNPEKWFSLMSPAEYQELKERIDLDFAYTNKTELAVDDPVGLDLYVKNVETLIIKVFEINTQNYYRVNLKEVGPDINLDGLVANEEKTYTYKEPPLRRVLRHFDFAALDKRGVYVIDFIGNGKASRAVIRKGKLRYVVRSSVAGQIFTIFDELNQPAAEANLWLAGTLYAPDENGTIGVPYSNQPARQPIVLSLGRFSSLDHFQQEAERYALSAGIYVDREQLIARRTAELIVRPRLTLNGTPVSRKVLEDVRLSITSTDLDNVSTTKEIADFQLFEDRETTYEFQVPQRLARIVFELKAKVQNQSQNQKLELAAQQMVSINEIDRTDKTDDLHFARAGENYILDLFGKTGEAKSDRPLQLALKLRDYTQPVNVSLQTNPQGRVVLGPLPGVLAVTASGPQQTAHTWNLPQDEHTYPRSIDGDADEPVEVPYMGAGEAPGREELSLLELRGDNFLADRFKNLALDGGLLQISKLPPGDYSLLLKKSGHLIRLRLTAGKHRSGYVLGDYRKLELRNTRPLQMRAVKVDEKTVSVQLQNASKLSRVHVFATRFQPAFSGYRILASIVPPEPTMWKAPWVESQYVAGRNIGDEYRYIIDRKFARKYPGNMLERPSLLLNPWAIRSTETGQQDAQAGEDFTGKAQESSATGNAAPMSPALLYMPTDFADLDFLAHSSIVLANVMPDKNGTIELKRSDLGPHQELLFVAVDPENTASRLVSLDQADNEFIDLRLAKGLDPKQHYTQQKQISFVAAGDQLVVADITSTKFEAYDSIGRVYGLYATLNGDAKLTDFNFVSTWSTLKPAEKLALYLKYASHEMHFFLYKKDPEFFQKAIRPYLDNKKEKKFLDHWLLEADLDDYLKPWNFEQLNACERILLGQRIKGASATTAQLIREQFELLPPDPERFSHLFQTALKGSALDTTDALGLIQAKEESEKAAMLAPGLAGALRMAVDAPAPAAKVPAPSDGRERDLSRAEDRRENAKQLAGLRKDLKSKSAKADEMLGEETYDSLSDDRDQWARVQQYYRTLDKTMEWVESNYYKLPLDQQNAGLITANAFWRDYAAHDPEKPFLSTNMAEATHNFPEMLLALSLLDFPFKAGEHTTVFEGTQMTLTAASPMIVYHEEIQPVEKVAENTPILVSQNFFRNGDRHRIVNGEQVDKVVSEEFLVNTVYGCQIVVTNPTSSKKKIDVLLQIPVGALPVTNSQYTRSVHIDLEPYHTQTLEYHFYFPSAGKYAHYPVQVASAGEILAFAAPLEFNVVDELTNIDKQSWDYVSQHGSEDDVLTFIKQQNILRVNLDRIAWRMQDKAFFARAIPLLAARHVYNHTLWSYAVKHNDAPGIRQFLQFANDFVNQCGLWLDSPLLMIDPIVRKTYEQMDYRPLVNPRVGRLGRQREILNDRFLAQYQQLLRILSYRRQLNDTELMAVVYYLLLQDRVEDGLDFFGRVNVEQLKVRLQYDYFEAYLDFYKSQPQKARTIAAKYADYPVERWQKAFANIVNQADEIDKPAVVVVDNQDRTQIQTAETAATPSFEFTVEAKKVKIHFQRLKEVRVNYYLMDVELLFSSNPFVQGESKQFSYIVPNQTHTIKLPADSADLEFALPEQLLNSNVLIEIVGAGLTQSTAYYSTSLQVQLIDNYGQLRVTHGKESAPLAKVYVKVYARMQDGRVRFYKDGYTDLRGRFDYTSLSTNELDHVDRFSLLILSEQQGAVVREAKPPKR